MKESNGDNLILVAILVLLFMAFTGIAKGGEHSVFDQITKINKDYRIRLSKDYISYLSSHITKVSKKYGLPPKIFTAILAQESQFDFKAMNCRTVVIKNTNSRIVGCSDAGISQVNVVTARSFGFDFNRLSHDLKYSLDAGAQVLYDFMKRYRLREKNWWSRYNSSNPLKRRQYEEFVARFF